jgi:hypothetical protein
MPAPAGVLLYNTPEPISQDAKPRVKPRVHHPFYITNVGGEHRVKSGVWRPEMWAQEVEGVYTTHKNTSRATSNS